MKLPDPLAHIRTSALAVAALVCASAIAQTTPADPTKEEEVIVLNPFRVTSSQDQGYRATNSVSGTRLNMAIKDIPMPIEVITEDFIDDIGAFDLKEALAYSAGAVVDTTFDRTIGGGPNGTVNGFNTQSEDNTPNAKNNAVRLRGFVTREQLKYGFRVSGIQDSSDMARMEVARGPQGLLYGVSVLGGVVNIIPKHALARPRYEVEGTIGSFGLRRIEFDASGPIAKDTLGYRLTGALQERGDWREFNDTTLRVVTPIVELRPTKATDVLLYFQSVDQKRTGVGFQDVSDSSRKNVFNESLSFGRDFGGKDNRFRWSGDDTWERARVNNAIINVTQRIGDHLSVNAGVNKVRTDNTRRIIQNQQYVAASNTITYEWNDQSSEVELLQARAELNVNWDLWGTKNNLLLGRMDIEEDIMTYSRQRAPGLALSSKSATDLSYFKWNGELNAPFRDANFKSWNSGHYAIYNGRLWKDRITAIAGFRWDRFMVRQIQWDYTNGVRNTFIRGSRPTDPANVRREWIGGPGTDLANEAPIREGYRFAGKPRTYENPTAGLVYKVTDELSVYALTASGVFPNTGQRDGRSNNLDAEESVSKEIGVKLDLFNGKISGTISAYKVDRANSNYNYSFAPSPRNNRPLIATGNGFRTDQPITYSVPSRFFPAGYIPAGDGRNRAGDRDYIVNYETLSANPVERAAIEAAFADPIVFMYDGRANNPSRSRNADVPFDEEVEGIDSQLIFQPLKTLQVLLNYAYTKRLVSNGFRFVDFDTPTTEYDVWVQRMGRENFTDVTRPSTFNGAILRGMELTDQPRHSGSMLVNYTIPSGPLKGFSIRPGIIYTGERLTTITVTGNNLGANAFPTPKLEDRFEYRLGFGYRTKILNHHWRFNLNIDNLLDDQKQETRVQYTNATTGLPVHRRTVNYYAPRSYRFSAGIVF